MVFSQYKPRSYFFLGSGHLSQNETEVSMIIVVLDVNILHVRSMTNIKITGTLITILVNKLHSNSTHG